MNTMKKKLRLILCCLLLSVSLAGCAKLISTETERVEVTIIDSYHRGAWTQPMMVGKTMTCITHPAIYEINVEYNDVEYVIDGRNTYDLFKDKIGQTVTGVLEIREYDDGTVKYDIIGLVEE